MAIRKKALLSTANEESDLDDETRDCCRARVELDQVGRGADTADRSTKLYNLVYLLLTVKKEILHSTSISI